MADVYTLDGWDDLKGFNGRMWHRESLALANLDVRAMEQIRQEWVHYQSTHFRKSLLRFECHRVESQSVFRSLADIYRVDFSDVNSLSYVYGRWAKTSRVAAIVLNGLAVSESPHLASHTMRREFRTILARIEGHVKALASGDEEDIEDRTAAMVSRDRGEKEASKRTKRWLDSLRP